MARARDGYRHPAVDGAFASLLDDIRPEVVHIGHLNHLSTSLVFEAKRAADTRRIHAPRLLADVSEGPVHSDVPQGPFGRLGCL